MVSFTPGSRTAWHTHPFGQILYIIHGRARVQTEGGKVVELGPGSTVKFAPGENHWHGAAPDERMVHLAIQEVGEDGSAADWGRQVTDSEYRGG